MAGDALPSASAALAGIPAGVQATGPWAGRRQLFVRFAGTNETATIYTADAMRSEVERLSARSPYHSIAIMGGDPLAEAEFLTLGLEGTLPLPVMLDHDGQRPESLPPLLRALALVQVTLSGREEAAAVERVAATIACAAARRVAHALVLVPAPDAGDDGLLRIVEQAHQASAETAIVVHPTMERAQSRDRRWVLWMERAMAIHDDVRLLIRLPSPTGMR
jgi:organic radical activating enzyme